MYVTHYSVCVQKTDTLPHPYEKAISGPFLDVYRKAFFFSVKLCQNLATINKFFLQKSSLVIKQETNNESIV